MVNRKNTHIVKTCFCLTTTISGDGTKNEITRINIKTGVKPEDIQIMQGSILIVKRYFLTRKQAERHMEPKQYYHLCIKMYDSGYCEMKYCGLEYQYVVPDDCTYQRTKAYDQFDYWFGCISELQKCVYDTIDSIPEWVRRYMNIPGGKAYFARNIAPAITQEQNVEVPAECCA